MGSGVRTAEADEQVLPVGRPDKPVTLRSWTPPGVSTLRSDQQAILELVCASFCRRLAEDLTSVLRVPVDLHVRPAEQLLWRDLLAALTDPYSAARVQWSPQNPAGLVTATIPLAVAWVDRILGGPGLASDHPEALTEVEAELVTDLHRRYATAFAVALGAVVDLQVTVGPHESRLGLIKAVPFDAELVVFDVELSAGATAGEVRLALPAEKLIPALDAFAGRGGAVPAGPLPPGAGLLDAPVEVAARFDAASLTPAELCTLAVGDVVTLPHPTGRPLCLWAANQPYLPVMPGRRSGRVAVAVLEAQGAA
jgi:flagellar motor switch protein FliM